LEPIINKSKYCYWYWERP